MTDAAIRCTTHHAACDCREAATRAALAAADALAEAAEDANGRGYDHDEDDSQSFRACDAALAAYRAARGAR